MSKSPFVIVVLIGFMVWFFVNVMTNPNSIPGAMLLRFGQTWK